MRENAMKKLSDVFDEWFDNTNKDIKEVEEGKDAFIQDCRDVEVTEMDFQPYWETVEKFSLAEEEIRILIPKVLAGSEVAKDKMINAHLDLVIQYAKKAYEKGRIISLDDLIQIGNRGLMRAINKIQRYDPRRPQIQERGFKNYLHWYIKGDMLLAIDKELEITSSERKLRTKIKALKKEYDEQGKSWPESVDEQQELIVQDLQVHIEDVKLYYAKISRIVSLNTEMGNEGENGQIIIDTIRDEAAYIERVMEIDETKEVFTKVYNELAEDERIILDIILFEEKEDWIYIDDYNEDIAKVLNETYSKWGKSEQKKERKRIANAKRRISNVVKNVAKDYPAIVGERRIVDALQKDLSEEERRQVSKFEKILEKCIVEYNRDVLKTKVRRILIDNACLNETRRLKDFFCQGYFSSHHLPLRREIIAMAFTERLDASHLDELLKAGGCSGLYVRQPEDFALYFALNNQYSLEQYIALCKKVNVMVEGQGVDLQGDATVGNIKVLLQKYQTENDNMQATQTITERISAWLSEIVRNGNEKELLEFVESNKVDFIAVRQRTYRVLMELLINYIETSIHYKNRYQNMITMNNERPLDERKIKADGLLKQMAEFCGQVNIERAITERNNLSNLLRRCLAVHQNTGVFPFDFTRDAFLSLITFLKQHDQYGEDRTSDFINSMNAILRKAGYEELDTDMPRDKSIIHVGIWGWRGNADAQEEFADRDVDYAIFWDGVCDIGESHRRSQYSFL